MAKTAMAKRPSAGSKLAQPLQRLSPGVYRGQGGALVNQGGRPLPGSRPPMSTGVVENRPGMVGIGQGLRQQRPLQDVARERADTINRGGMVTMDYNPEREALVNQYLEQMRSGQMQAPGMNRPQVMPGQVIPQGFGQGAAAGMGQNPGLLDQYNQNMMMGQQNMATQQLRQPLQGMNQGLMGFGQGAAAGFPYRGK